MSFIYFDIFVFLGIESDDIKLFEKVYLNLSVFFVSGDKILYYGVVEILFKLGENELIIIFFLVSDILFLIRLILGYNVIEYFCCFYGLEDFIRSLFSICVILYKNCVKIVKVGNCDEIVG